MEGLLSQILQVVVAVRTSLQIHERWQIWQLGIKHEALWQQFLDDTLQ